MVSSLTIISCIENYPMLYDPQFERSVKRLDCWNQVSLELETDVKTIQRKWKNLRDSYKKYLNDNSTNFRLSAEMKFLDPYFKNGLTKKIKKIKIKSLTKQIKKADESLPPRERRKRKAKKSLPDRRDMSSIKDDSDNECPSLKQETVKSQLNESDIFIDSEFLDEKFLSFAKSVKILSKNDILIVLDQISQIISERADS